MSGLPTSVTLGTGLSVPQILRMGDGADVDIPFRLGEEFPFEDRALAAIDCGSAPASMGAAARLAFLLECRRCLEPDGVIDLVADSDKLEDLIAAAARVGLRLVQGGARNVPRFTKLDRVARGSPLVSIVIPAYNPRFFAAALDSAIAQSHDTIGIAVCDDSPDHAIETIVRARSGLRPINYARNAIRLGPRANFERCLESVRGEFVKFLCGDEPGHGIIDMVTWAALLLKGDAVYLSEHLSSFRIHPGQRQHDPAKAARNVASIRSLQAAWLKLGLNERTRPDELLVKPFALEQGADWCVQPVLGFAARPIAAN